MFDLRSALKLFVYFTVLTKIVFIISAAAHANAVRKGDKSRAKETLQWKELDYGFPQVSWFSINYKELRVLSPLGILIKGGTI